MCCDPHYTICILYIILVYFDLVVINKQDKNNLYKRYYTENILKNKYNSRRVMFWLQLANEIIICLKTKTPKK